jgi:hypothetical protein
MNTYEYTCTLIYMCALYLCVVWKILKLNLFIVNKGRKLTISNKLLCDKSRYLGNI